MTRKQIVLTAAVISLAATVSIATLLVAVSAATFIQPDWLLGETLAELVQNFWRIFNIATFGLFLWTMTFALLHQAIFWRIVAVILFYGFFYGLLIAALADWAKTKIVAWTKK